MTIGSGVVLVFVGRCKAKPARRLEVVVQRCELLDGVVAFPRVVVGVVTSPANQEL